MNKIRRPNRSVNLLSALTWITAVVIVSPILPVAPTLARQSGDIDKDLMKRDLEIMESILDRLLSPADRGFVNLSGSSTSAFYLPGFGVMIETSSGVSITGKVVFMDRRDTINGQFGVYPDHHGNASDSESEQDESDHKIAEIRETITNFLKNYAGVINQLKPDDRVAVIYTRRGQIFMPGLITRDSGDKEANQFRSMTIVARFSDLDAYRRGRMNDEAFNNNLTVSTVMSGDAPRTDIEIFGRILDTGLKTGDRESVSIRGNISRFYVEGVGAMFNLQAGMGSRAVLPRFDLEALGAGLEQQGRRLEEQADQLRRQVQEIERIEAQTEQLRQQAREIEAMARRFPADTSNFNRQLNVVQARMESLFPDPEKFTEEYGIFEQNLKAYMVDYGRTLNSLKPGESLFISVSISGGHRSNLPGRIIYKIEKDAIERYDRRSITRDQAIGQIVKMEY